MGMSNDLQTFCAEHAGPIAQLAQRFADYAPITGGMNSARIQSWLSQFKAQHRALALKVAGLIKYYSSSGIHALMPELRQIIDQQTKAEGIRADEVFYVPLARTGESGYDVVRAYRNANSLHGRQKQFINLIDLPARMFACSEPM